MAKQTNPLTRYRSYAYHHILIACDSTTTAISLQEKGNVTELQRMTEQRGQRDKKFEGISVAGGPGDNYVVLMDGLVDSDFYITSLNFNTIMIPSDTGQQTMAQITGEFEVFEPYSVMFLERMVDLCDTLNTDPIGLVFMIKTVFVGFNDPHHGAYNRQMIPDAKPLMFNIVKITSVIDETGATHTMQFVGIANGIAKMPYSSNIGSGFSIAINKDATLGEALGAVEEELNAEYEAFANSLGLSFATESATPDDTGGARPDIVDKTKFANGGEFRPVRYKIEANDYLSSKYIAVSNEEDRNESDGKVVVQFGDDQNVEDIINQVMKGCVGVMEDSALEKDKSIYKINSFLKSTPTEAVIEYQVTKYKMVTSTMADVINKNTKYLGESPNIREYDYIFTGQNTDIIEFDINLDLGLTFFNTAALEINGTDQGSGKNGTPSSTVSGGGSGGQLSKTGKPRGKTPLFLGNKITNPKIRNKKNSTSTATFNSLLTRHAQMENIAVTMKIHGDPSLMSEMLVTSTTDIITGDTKQTYMTAPALIKVNIKMPDSRINPENFKQFWWDGYYILRSVESIFDDGRFTQVLSMISVPITSESDTVVDDPEKKSSDNKKSTGTAASVASNVIGDETMTVRGMNTTVLGNNG